MRAVLLFIISLQTSLVFGQVDLTKYANQDLFEIKPVIDKEVLSDVENQNYESDFEYRVNKAIDLLQNNQPEQALSIFNEMTRLVPEEPTFHYFLGLTYYMTDSIQFAIEKLQRAIELNPIYYEADYLLAMIMLDEAMYDDCAPLFKKLIESEEYTSLGWYGKGMLEASLGRPFKSKSAFNNSIKNNPTFAASYFPLAIIELYQGNIKRTLKHLNTAIELDSTWQEPLISRGLVSLLIDENTTQFEKDIETLMMLDPNNYHYRSIKGFLEIQNADYASALDHFRSALNMKVDTSNAGSYKFSTKLQRDKDLRYILNYYLEHKYKLETEFIRLMDIGVCEFIEERFDTSLKYVDSLIAQQDHPIIYFLEGLNYENKYNDGKAIDSYTSVVKRDPNNVYAFKKRCDLHLNLGDHDLALRDINKVIELEPKKKYGYKSRGSQYLNSNEFAKAYRDFTRCLYYDSTDLDVFFNRAICASRLKYYQESNKDLTYLLEIDSSDAEAYFLKASNYFETEQYSRSLSEIDNALKYKDAMDYYELKGKVLFMQGDYRKAVNLYETAYGKYSFHRQFQFFKGYANYMLENYSDAQGDLKKYLKAVPDDGEGHYYLGQGYQKLGKQKLASKHLQMAKKLGFDH